MPWLRVSIEAVAIVGSILLAFGIQAWWDERGADDLRARALEAVLVDMQENTSELERWIAINGRIIENSDLLLDLLETAPEDATVAVPDTLLAAAVLIPTFDPRLASVEAVTTTGSVTLVQDDDLRADLGAWLRLLDDVVEDETEVRTIESLQIAPSLGRQVNLRPIYANVLAWAEGQEVLRTSTSELIPNGELIGYIAHRQLRMSIVEGHMLGLLELQKAIAEEIRATLAP